MLRLNVCSKIFLIFLILTNTVNAEPITEWPTQNQINISAFKNRFIEAFKSQPGDLGHIYQGLVNCDLPDDKARKISGITKEILESPYKSNTSMDVEIDLDVDRLNILSTENGCAELKTIKLENVSTKKRISYQVPSSFKTPFMIDTKYKIEQTMTMQINGDSHQSESTTEMDILSLFLYPQQPAHPDFPHEIYSITDMEISTTSIQSYSIAFVSNDKAGNRTTLSRSTTNGAPANSLMFHGKNALGQDRFSMYTKDLVMTMLDGKRHGLMSSKNPLYKVMDNQEPISYTCHAMGEKVNIFKVISDSECVAATKEQLGEENVYMDAIYKITYDRENPQLTKNNIASPMTRKTSNYESPSAQARKAELAKKTKLKTHFNKLKSEAKCKLSNDNWAYTGTNCKKGLAHGKGSAEDHLGLKFIGTFKSGNRVKGEIHQNGEMIFSGELVDDKPSGSAICLYENEYEECKFFRGKRIDTLYKLRKENAKNQKMMAAMQKQNATVVTKQNESSNMLVDALEEEAVDRAASFIFDKLF